MNEQENDRESDTCALLQSLALNNASGVFVLCVSRKPMKSPPKFVHQVKIFIKIKKARKCKTICLIIKIF